VVCCDVLRSLVLLLLLLQGAMLEPRMGSPKFAGLLLELLLLSHGLVVAASAAASACIPDYKYLWFSTCAVGFSAVIFALKVVLQHDSPGYSSVFGFQLPTKVC
jgi:rhomboid domain-containing protein 1